MDAWKYAWMHTCIDADSQQTRQPARQTDVHSITLHYIPFHSSPFHSIPLHYITLHTYRHTYIILIYHMAPIVSNVSMFIGKYTYM